MIRIGIATIIGVASGVTIEKYRQKHDTLWHVNAAKPFEDSLQTATTGGVTGGGGGRVSEITRYGLPSYDSIRSYENFVLSYDRRNRTALWVLEHMTPDNIIGNKIDRSKIEFFEDPSIHHYFRATNFDYKYSGYDRGHLAAAGNHRSDIKLVTQTFVLSNISPQVGKGFNRDAWNKLEKYCRFRAKKCHNTYVCTGPLYVPQKDPNGKMYVKYEVIGKNHVSVPTHFFKVLLMETHGNFDIESYIMPNKVIDENIPLESFQVPVDAVERSAGFLLFERIPKNKLRSINGKQIKAQ